jgi:hypothetical protein
LLDLDDGRYHDKPFVEQRLATHREFRPVSMPEISPNLNREW